MSEVSLIANGRAGQKPTPAGAGSLRPYYGLIQLIGVLAVLVISVSIYSPRFLSPVNISNLLGQLVVILPVAAGMTIIIIAGELDVSVGAMVGLTGACLGWLTVVAPSQSPNGWLASSPALATALGIVLPLLVGPLFGVISGLMVTKAKVPSFIVTLGTLMIARSLSLVLTAGQSISGIPASLKAFGALRPLVIPVPGSEKSIQVPLIFLVAAMFYVVGWLLMERMAFGRRVYAVGANRSVATLAGIRSDRVKIACFATVGFCASAAGMLNAARIGAVGPTSGAGLEFEVIAAVVIGGISLAGGQGRIGRTIFGVVIIVLIRNVLNLVRIDIFWQDFATGAIILAAVLLDALQKRITGAR
jgi:ribose/xylose/arabinose/galactoside ABC-type transport system permease subunit